MTTIRNVTLNDIFLSDMIMHIYPPDCDFLDSSLICSCLFVNCKYKFTAKTHINDNDILICIEDENGAIYREIMKYYDYIGRIELEVQFADHKTLARNVVIYSSNMMYNMDLTTFMGKVNLHKDIIERMNGIRHKLNVMIGM